MSEKVGLYVDGDWYTERPSWLTLYRARPTKWYWRVARGLSFVALIAFWFSVGMWFQADQTITIMGIGHSDLATLFAAITLGSVVVYIMYLLELRPAKKRYTRAKLIKAGVLYPRGSYEVKRLLQDVSGPLLVNWNSLSYIYKIQATKEINYMVSLYVNEAKGSRLRDRIALRKEEIKALERQWEQNLAVYDALVASPPT
ncbi:MAG: hypothetical protein KDA17_04415 [Candidatus Saccharibacteria bacterium]|nr:hypothetical protein [Candidatus Saccharibacteria bacterium]